MAPGAKRACYRPDVGRGQFLFIDIDVVPTPSGIALGFWIVVKIQSVGMGGGVARFANIGGFPSGLALVLALVRRRSRWAAS